MKKLLAILLSALILMSVMSTAVLALELPNISEIVPDDGVTFYALVIDATIGKTGNCGLQLCALNINDINHRGLCNATAKEDTELLDADGEITMEDISAGDIIAITYTGEVLESYPSTVLGVTRVYVVDHVDSLDEIVDLLPDGYDDNGDYFPAWNNLFGPAVIDYTTGDGKVTLSWNKTDDESYTVYWKRSSSEEWKVAGTTTKHTVNITGLKNGISYDFKVEISGEDSEVVTAIPTDDIWAEIDGEDVPGSEINNGRAGLTLVEGSVTSTGATFILHNYVTYVAGVDGDLEFGYYERWLQVYENGEWRDVINDYEEDVITPADAAYIEEDGEYQFTVNWESTYGELPAGHYRYLMRGEYYKEDSFYVACGFDIE